MRNLTSKDTTFGTPDEVFRYYNEWYGPFDLDAAANAKNALCRNYLGPGGLYPDALALDIHWHKIGKRVWLNPPYGRWVLGDFVRRAWEEHRKGCRVVMLLPAATGPEWFRRYCKPYERHWLGRLNFKGGKFGARQDAMVVILNPPAPFKMERD